MESTVNNLLGGREAWDSDLDLDLSRLGALGFLSYTVGFFPLQWAASNGVLNSSEFSLFVAAYVAIAIVTTVYISYELFIEGDERAVAAHSIRGYSLYLVNVSFAFIIALLAGSF